jgi:hypothetical protein
MIENHETEWQALQVIASIDANGAQERLDEIARILVDSTASIARLGSV